jgi:hypothetical protein
MDVDLNQAMLLGIAVAQAVTAYMAYKSHMASKRSEVNIQKIETATNSMKDALVTAAGQKGFRDGVESTK